MQSGENNDSLNSINGGKHEIRFSSGLQVEMELIDKMDPESPRVNIT